MGTAPYFPGGNRELSLIFPFAQGRCGDFLTFGGRAAGGRQGDRMGVSSIKEAIADIKNGRMVILVDDEDRENEGDLCMAAQFVTPEAINFMARYRRGPTARTGRPSSAPGTSSPSAPRRAASL